MFIVQFWSKLKFQLVIINKYLGGQQNEFNMRLDNNLVNNGEGRCVIRVKIILFFCKFYFLSLE